MNCTFTHLFLHLSQYQYERLRERSMPIYSNNKLKAFLSYALAKASPYVKSHINCWKWQMTS